tara:strand:- start:15 stop:716 length:702 start_codon:yes stop_codon:yes gene_type:complete
MTKNSDELIEVKNKVMSNPEIILDDVEVMRALFNTYSNAIGENVIDLRSVAIEKLESKIKRAETTNRSIIAAAYENISGYELIHKAILLILETDNFEDLQLQLCRTVQQTLKVSHIHIMIEQEKPEDSVIKSNSYISIVKAGSVKNYINLENELLQKTVTMRRVSSPNESVYGEKAHSIKSEAVIQLDLREKKLSALLIIGSNTATQFEPKKGTELLAFFGSVIERVIRRWTI